MPESMREEMPERMSEDMQKICQIECWMKECQKICQKECQKECQNNGSIHARKLHFLRTPQEWWVLPCPVRPSSFQHTTRHGIPDQTPPLGGVIDVNEAFPFAHGSVRFGGSTDRKAGCGSYSGGLDRLHITRPIRSTTKEKRSAYSPYVDRNGGTVGGTWTILDRSKIWDST